VVFGAHVGGYIGNGQIFEVLLSGAVQRPLNVYRSQRYRIGLYRPSSYDGDVEKPDNLTRIKAYIEFCRFSIGRTKYDYIGLVQVGINKILNRRLKTREPRFVSPCDLATFPEVRLLLTI
jgi:hypothetical protein